MAAISLILGTAVYVSLGRALTRSRYQRLRDILFAALNLAAVYLVFFHGGSDHYVFRFCAYVALAVFQYAMLYLFVESRGGKYWLAFFTPIAALIFCRYLPPSAIAFIGQAVGRSWHAVPAILGISYFAFRSSYLVLEVRNGVVPKPSLWQYLGYCFFLPTMSVGPINSYQNHSRAFTLEAPCLPVNRALLRVLIGAVKFAFLAPLSDRLSYSGLLMDGHPHPWADLPVAIFFYYLYLYCNFSGFCDMAIGVAGLIGVPVAENFDDPFAARNVRDFWNRWHITLSHYMRDVVFAPLSKFLVRWVGPNYANHAIAFAIFVVFLLVGIWHGTGWNFAAFGIVHAIGVVANHYYTIWLKRRLGREGFRAYNENRWIHAVAVCLTFCYCAASLLFFANTFGELQTILASLR